MTTRPRYSRDDSGQSMTNLPNSPKHKLSDSYSSLSSYASSSLQSGCHSRISSLSTVSGGTQAFPQLLNDMPSFETKLAEHQQLGPGLGQLHPSASRELHPVSPRTSVSQPSAIISSSTLEDDLRRSNRPGSPTDAILITRVAGSNRSSPTDASRYVIR